MREDNNGRDESNVTVVMRSHAWWENENKGILLINCKLELKFFALSYFFVSLTAESKTCWVPGVYMLTWLA